MALGWNEIKDRAVRFSKEWEDAHREEADAKPFLEDFFNVFGISRRKVATFEERVKRLGDHDGYIDLLWKGTMLVEMKSRGKDLDKAYQQAIDYTHGLKDYELPKYILVSDFASFRLFNLDDDSVHSFELQDLVQHVHLFGFIAGYKKQTYKEEDPVNVDAAYLMGKLHDELKESGYTGHQLEMYLVRLLFCLFAEDTTIFEPNAFEDYIINRTHEDGSDLGLHLAQIFQVLNTPVYERLKTLEEDLAAFPFVNGHLFEEQLRIAAFNSRMRSILLECCRLDWSKISPAIFGSMFQSVMDEKARRNLGAHYTSEKNILKLIKPLFLDRLWDEYESVKGSTNKLKAFHRKIASLRFLDPACGCGNFLVITYRELRLLELEIMKTLQVGQRVTDIEQLMLCDVDRFYGIEYEEFPAQIAQVAMWLMDHQMNMLVSQEFGQYYVRLPLRRSAKIVHGNALSTHWDSIIEVLPWESQTDRQRFDYILGNPPFIGSKLMTQEQRNEVVDVFEKAKGSGVMDYVSAWYVRAAQYIHRHNTPDVPNEQKTRVAFVSTNSIAQGEQVGVLWHELFTKYGIKIHFAHRTFRWSNEARGIAAVHVVIIGFSNFDTPHKILYEYESITGEPHGVKVRNINPYLVEGKDLYVQSRTKPICNVPLIKFGNQPIDGGFLLFSEEEKIQFISEEPNASKFIRQYVGSHEFINNDNRYCLWLENASPYELKKLPKILERLEKVKQFRLESKREDTRKLAVTPSLFAFVSHTESDYIIIPSVSSERRSYIPIGFLPSNIIASNLCLIIPNAELYHFGVLTSEMHMAWVRFVCGRLESRFRYSNSIVYNNYPWPQSPTPKQVSAIEEAAQRVLDARLQFPNSSLAVLYDPLTMPPALVKAHQQLDRAVDAAYRPQPFTSEAKRIEFLFELYDQYTAGLFAPEKKKRGRKSDTP
ncbi:MAG TPA: methylase [Tenuifilaceae bacterium]|nr:methylase [Tenuifilaceae bacterium]HQC67255.1 methylase [Tenuifilaceae bacterium]